MFSRTVLVVHKFVSQSGYGVCCCMLVLTDGLDVSVKAFVNTFATVHGSGCRTFYAYTQYTQDPLQTSVLHYTKSYL